MNCAQNEYMNINLSHNFRAGYAAELAEGYLPDKTCSSIGLKGIELTRNKR